MRSSSLEPSRPPEREPIARADLATGLGLAALASILYGVTAPSVVNMDGLGYIKLIPHNFAAGHLLYMPLLRLFAALLGDGLRGGRALSLLAGGSAVGLTFACARSLLPRFQSTLAASGLALCYGVWAQGNDVEAYACALAAALWVLAIALSYRARPSLARAIALGLALALAVLLHLTHVLLTPFVFAWALVYGARGTTNPEIPDSSQSRPRGLLHGLIACAIGGAVTLGGYAWAALKVRRLDLPGAVRWIATAGHGFPYQGGLKQRLADATYGLAKAFVWSPYLYESDAQTLLGQFLLGLLPLVAVGSLIALRRRAAARLPWRLFAVWMAAYAAMALAFFGSDHERWVFLLPPLWILLAAAVGALGAKRRAVAVALVTYLAAANAWTAIGPQHRDTWIRTRADVAATLVHDDDLVIFPGHSWDEYIGFYTHTRVVPFPLAYYVGRDGREAGLARMEREIALARKRGSAVYAVRIFDDDDDSRGLYELSALGMPPPAVRQLFARFHAVRLSTVEPKVFVWRLDDPPR